MSQELKARIAKYWNNRADAFKNQSIAEMQNERYEEWMEIIVPRLPQGKQLKVLDIGTGSGYMAMLLASQGHSVIGVDLCENMIAAAKAANAELGLDCIFEQRDAEKLDFPPESFDVIITRNLTWTLPHVPEDYALWYSFLKYGGVLMNFDADYGKSNFSKPPQIKPAEEKLKPVEAAPKKNLHGVLSAETLAECEAIKGLLDITKHRRPGWDINLLRDCGFTDITLKSSVHKFPLQRKGGMFGIFAYKN